MGYTLLIVGFAILILVIQYVLNATVNKASDFIDNKVRDMKEKNSDGPKEENLADKYK